jgi:serine/threonine protein kinase/tetratricopeptide (TPR) repeat protein
VVAPPHDEQRTAAGDGNETLVGDGTLSPGDPTIAADGAADGAAVRRPRLSPGQPLVAGMEIGRYVVLERVGAGAMGDVYAAYDPELDRRVALKMLRAERRTSDVRRARLLREAQSIAKLDHPNVIGVYDVGQVDEQLYIAMEFADAGTLTRWLAEADRSFKDVLARLRDAGAGLAAAHAAGVVHRDFKPDNVLITAEGRAKVADFGIARWAEGPTSGPVTTGRNSLEVSERARPSNLTASPDVMTRTGDMLGTPRYMAPEQHGLGTGDELSDQFAFCVTAWEALFGQQPFSGGNLAALATAKFEGRIREPPSSDVPTWVTRALRRGLSADPSQRWPSMAALLVALGDDPRRRRRRWLGLVGVLGVGAVLGALPKWSRPPRPDDPCPRADAQLRDVWNASRRDAVTKAFAQTKVAWAPAVGRGVTDALDAYVTEWLDVQQRSCRATWTEHVDPADVLTARNECLEHARRQLSETVQWLEAATPDRVTNAVRNVATLPTPTDCWEMSSLSAWLDLPADPDARAAALTLQADIEAFVGQVRVLEPEARTVQLATLSERARVLGVRSLSTRLALTEARLMEGRDLDAARDQYEALLWDSIAHDDTRVAFSAAVELLWVDGYLAGDSERAAGRRRAAEALLQRLGDPPSARGELLSRMGAVHYAAGQIEAAMRDYQDALDIGQTDTLAHRLSAADLEFNLASLMMEEGAVGDALERFDSLERVWTDLVGPDHPELVSLSTNRSIALRRMGDAEGAVKAAERSRTLCGEGQRAAAGQCIDAEVAMAEANELAGDPEAAIAAMTAALKGRRAMLGAGHPRVLMYEVRLVQLLVAAGRVEDARAYALAPRGRGEDELRAAGIIAALVAEADGDLEGALAALPEAALGADEAEAGLEWLDANAALARARALRGLGRYDDAIAILGPLSSRDSGAEPREAAAAQAELARAQLSSPDADRPAIEASLRDARDHWLSHGRSDLLPELDVVFAEQGWDP